MAVEYVFSKSLGSERPSYLSIDVGLKFCNHSTLRRLWENRRSCRDRRRCRKVWPDRVEPRRRWGVVLQSEEVKRPNEHRRRGRRRSCRTPHSGRVHPRHFVGFHLELNEEGLQGFGCPNVGHVVPDPRAPYCTGHICGVRLCHGSGGGC